MTEGKRIVRAMIIVSSASLLSVALGFGVQVTLAAFYGASRTMDTYFVAIALPILLSSVTHSVLTYTLVPILKTRVVAGNSQDFWGLASAVFATVGGMACVTVVGLILFAEGIIALLAPGLDAATRWLAIDAFRIVVIGLVFDSLRAVLETVYLSRERFFLPQFVPALFYLVMLACITLLASSLGISGVALGWLMGFALIFVLLGLPLAREYVQVHPRTLAYVRDIPWRALAVGAGAVALFQSTPLIDRAIASGLPAGSISYLGYGGKVLDILMRIVPMALGLAVFPRASEYVARNEILQLRMQVRRYLRTGVLISLPIAVAVAILRVPVITLFFERGAFDATATNQVTNVIVWYMVAFVPMSVLTILTYTFYSLRRLSTVVALGLLNVTLTLVGDVLFSRWWGYVGIAISNACVATALVTVAWLALERGDEMVTAKPTTRAIDRVWLGNLALGAGIMALGMYALQSFAFPGFPRGGVLLADLTSVSSVGALLYIGTMLLRRNPELLLLTEHIVKWFATRRGAVMFARQESHVALKIAIDTLYEDPFNPTGAQSWNMHIVQELAQIDRVNQYLVLVSNVNRHFFRVDAPNFRLVNCFFSNEHRILRILVEQMLIPLYARMLGVDVLFAPGNTAPLLNPGKVVLNIKTMHHRTASEGMGAMRMLFRNLMIGLSARKAKIITANSESNRQDICAYLNVPHDKIRLIPEGLDHSLFKPMEDKAEIANRLAERGIRVPYVLYVSGLWRYKNVETLIHAFAHLIRDRSIAHNLVIVGKGYRDYEDFLFALVRQLGLERRVQFVGFVPYTETPLFYNGADVFVLPSKYETFGRITTEAMACGAPVVASNASSIPEVVGDAGVLVSPTNALEMAEAIRRIIQDRDWRAELVTRGFKRAQDFSWEKNVESLHKVLIEAAGLPIKAQEKQYAMSA